MAWFTPADFEKRLPLKDLRWLSTQDGQAEEPDEAVLQDCLDRAETEVRGCLAGRAQLPATLEPGLIWDLALDLAVEGLFLRSEGEAAKLPEGWQGRLKRSRALLDDLVDGTIPLEAGPAIPPTPNRMVALNPHSPVDGAFR